MATKSKTKIKTKVKEAPPVTFDISTYLNDTVETVARKQGYDSTSLDDIPGMSTGLLCMDLLTGGIKPAWYTNFGAEQSAKTTSALTILASAVQHQVPIASFSDYEGSTRSSAKYVSSIFKGVGIRATPEKIFGKRAEDGSWEIAPMVRYRSETRLEAFFDFMAEVLRTLPDKRYINGEWWLVFENNKVNKSKVGEHAVAYMAKKFGDGLWVKAQDGNLQAVFLVDSYPAMNPTQQDKEDTNNSLALQARSFSQQIPRVKGRMAQKMVAVVGVNQLRAVPMAMYGPSESEPGGNALKLYSDCRVKHTSRALSAAPYSPTVGKKIKDEHEESVLGGVDRYRYVHIKAIKNKLANPQRELFMRIWVEDAEGDAQGIDPVFDVIQYLTVTGQLKGTRAKFTLTLDKLGEANRPIKWMVLKKWVLGDKDTKAKISEALGYPKLDLRKLCFQQIKSGRAESMYTKHNNSKVKPAADDEGESE